MPHVAHPLRFPRAPAAALRLVALVLGMLWLAPASAWAQSAAVPPALPRPRRAPLRRLDLQDAAKPVWPAGPLPVRLRLRKPSGRGRDGVRHDTRDWIMELQD